MGVNLYYIVSLSQIVLVVGCTANSNCRCRDECTANCRYRDVKMLDCMHRMRGSRLIMQYKLTPDKQQAYDRFHTLGLGSKNGALQCST